jgi:glycosyltransferase involved in cell wall biosynthesis
MKDLARRLGVADRVRFLGYVADMRHVIGAADLVLFPTAPGFGEGFGLVNLEAMAMERPVVASRVASVPEVVEHGVTGLLVEPDNVGQFADALVELDRDERRRQALGRAGRERARRRFSLAAMVESTSRLYEEAVSV